jgi:hypothetical protein
LAGKQVLDLDGTGDVRPRRAVVRTPAAGRIEVWRIVEFRYGTEIRCGGVGDRSARRRREGRRDRRGAEVKVQPDLGHLGPAAVVHLDVDRVSSERRERIRAELLVELDAVDAVVEEAVGRGVDANVEGVREVEADRRRW